MWTMMALAILYIVLADVWGRVEVASYAPVAKRRSQR